MLKRLFSRRARDADADTDQIDSAEEESAPAKRPENGGLTLARIYLLGFLASVALVAALAWLAYQQLQSLVEAQYRVATTAQGERLAAEIAGRVQGLAEVVENVASQPALVADMSSGDLAAAAGRAETVASAIPGAQRIRFLPLGTTEPDETQLPRLGYAGVDLAREAEKGRRPPFEVHWFGAPDQHIALARAIGAPRQPPVGVLMVNLDLKLLDRWLQAALPEGGYAEVRQTTGDTQVLLTSRGEASLKGLPPTAAVKLAGTAWELNYWLPAQAGALSTTAQTMFLGLFAVAALLLGLIFLIFGSIAGKLVRGDLEKLVEHLFTLLQRKREHGYTVRLREFRKAVQVLDEHLHLPPQAEAPARTTQEPEPVPEDPLFMQHGNISVEEVPPEHKE